MPTPADPPTPRRRGLGRGPGTAPVPVRGPETVPVPEAAPVADTEPLREPDAEPEAVPVPEAEAERDPEPVPVPEPEGDDKRFTVRLVNFEGPFDLLLQLISKHKLDVTEVALSKVTDEFMA
ncbi:segregation/condensation protein A, partial [Streptomyces sp. DSM 41640]|nr:segregation/condensation protein A [Streptomyces sp. DSM 41640]